MKQKSYFKANFKSPIKNSDGFTLIELLVVIAIIGLLASVVLVALNGARLKARDTRRIADLHQIQNALDLYYSKNTSYPAAGGVNYDAARSNSCADNDQTTFLGTPMGDWNTTMNLLVSDGELSSIPKDPSNTGNGTINSLCYAYTFSASTDPTWRRCGSTYGANDIQISDYSYVIFFTLEGPNVNNYPYVYFGGVPAQYKYCLLGPHK